MLTIKLNVINMEYLNNLLYKHLKSESPAWWNTIINDPDIHIEIRKEYSARQKAIVEKELDEFNVRYSHDSTFAREARLLQSKWRVKKNYPIGKTRNGTPMGNYIDSTFAKEKEVNLLTENIRKIAHLELEEAKSTGALIQEDRLWGNFL